MAERETDIQRNQNAWRSAERGVLSRPHELVLVPNFLHQRMVKTFDLENAEKPIMVWSTVFDNPRTPNSEFVYAERYPEEIQEEDKANFHRGIVRITEFATNYATREFLRKNATAFADIYGALADQATYGLIFNGTFRRMKAVEITAERNGKNFKEALLTGLFNHDFSPMNELVADTKEHSGWNGINDLAIEIGSKRFKKPDIGRWLDKLEIERTDSQPLANIKNCLVSVLAGGVFRSPGVIEVSAGIVPVAFLETAIIYAAHKELDSPLLAYNLATIMLPLLSITPFAAIHEGIHYYSADREYMGYIPAKLIKKKVTPYLARLEPEEKV